MRRYRLTLLLLLVCVLGMGMMFTGRSGQQHTKATLPPAQVIVGQAVVVDQGVRLDWLAAQPGTHPVGGYLIERRRDNGSFTHIARVEKISLHYLDAEGKTGDVYRVIALDDRQPAGRSAPSASVLATAAKPGSTVVIESSSGLNVLGLTTPVESGGVEKKIVTLQEHMARLFAALDADLARNNFAAVNSHLTALQDYQRQILNAWPRLSPDQKRASTEVCIKHEAIFEANLHVLPERAQLNGMLVAAGCSAMREMLL